MNKYIIGATLALATLQGVSQPRKKYTPTIDDIIEREARINDLSPDLIRAIIKVESNWITEAVSHKGAIGLMQVMPANARYCGYEPEEMKDPEKGIICGTRIYREELDRFKNHYDAVRAYNCGSPRAKRNRSCGAKYAGKVLDEVA